MDHFMVSVPRRADQIVHQNMRDRVADTIEASIHPQRFSGIEEAPAPLKPFTPSDIEAALRKQPAFEELPTEECDYSDSFQPIGHRSASPLRASGLPGQGVAGAEFKPVMDGEETLADARSNDEGWWQALYAVACWLVIRFGGGCLVGIGIVTGVRAALRWWWLG
jgi:hypothetical protein